ncbi:Asp23/Gls24 family envelope stress response protein [Acidaminobacter sp. JC074]|uniref:Asp23/Gls24 family envelope stress response protein n=1 Tax=Acidaminobacter sp. JC074 TaxID=2530199 RepID=UPI001F0E44CD|nr:Asp23/Gls24 family envelope stress response protein [Acidaminobacter sp. JC074]MCH4888819.1 Asp23/Gls24 family envelope stress response protein [Acidaminobacter sp. JC074]
MSEKEIQAHEFGHVNISDDVIGIITNIAASEIEGIQLAGTLAGDIAEILGRKNMTKGVRVEINDEDEVQVDLNIVVDFGVVIPEIAWKVQESVKTAIENMTDLKVTSIDVNVQGINLDKDHDKVDE